MTRREWLTIAGLSSLGAAARSDPATPALQLATLDNGASLLFAPEPASAATAIVACLRFFPGDDGGAEGLLPLVARLMGTDAEGRTGALLQTDIDAFGAFGVEFEESALVAWTVSATADFEIAAQTLLLNTIARPRFTEEAFEDARAALRREIVLRRDNPQIETLARLRGRALGSEIAPLGTLQSLRDLTVAQVQRFHARFFRPDRLSLVVAGKGEIEAVKKTLEACLNAGGWKDLAPAPAPRPPAPPIPVPAQLRELALPLRAPATIYARGYLLPGLAQPGAAADFPALLLADAALGGGKACRLFPLRDRLSLAYDVRSALVPGRETTFWAAYLLGQLSRDAVRDAMTREVDSLARGVKPFTDAELARAKALVKGQRAVARQRLVARARRLTTAVALGLGPAFETDFEARIDAVALSDVNRVARELLSGNAAVAYTLPSSD